MRQFLTIVGIVMILIGGLWVLQGANVIGGSVMTGQSHWVFIGAIVVAAGLALTYWTNWVRKS